jgi:hypothetical protein
MEMQQMTACVLAGQEQMMADRGADQEQMASLVSRIEAHHKKKNGRQYENQPRYAGQDERKSK